MNGPIAQTDLQCFDGKLQSIFGGKIVGWIFDRNNPHHTIFVDIWVNGQRICSVAANEASTEPIEDIGERDGHGFSAQLPIWINLEKPCTIRVSVLGLGQEVPGWSMRLKPSAAGEKRPFTSDDRANFKPNVFYRLLSPSKEMKPASKALIGKDGWLFLAHDSNSVIDQIQGRVQMQAGQLLQYQRAFGHRMRRFSKLGIPYLFFAAPTKELVCLDKLPDGMLIDENNFPMNQIVSAVADEGFVIRPLLGALTSSRLHRDGADVFHRTDTHWNLAGGYAAYKAILSEISEMLMAISPFNIDDFRFRKQFHYRGDLADKPKVVFLPGQKKELVEVAEGEFPSDMYDENIDTFDSSSLKYKNGFVDEYLKVSPTRDALVHENKSGVGPRIVVFHDSFMLNVFPFLSSHFSRSVYVWKPEPDFDIIERERPDIVVSVMLDRFMRLPPSLIQ